jgi:hypothetical protein
MRTRSAIVIAAALTVTVLTAVEASAQASTRPYRGLFGAPASADSPHSLVASASAFAAYDDNVLSGLSNQDVGSPWLQQSGTYQGANAGLQYTFQTGGERFTLAGSTGAQVNYFTHGSEAEFLPDYRGDVVFSARLTRSLSFNVRQSLGYSSTYAPIVAPGLGMEPGHEVGIADDPGLALFGLRTLRSATRASLSQRFGRFASLAAAYHLQSTQVFDADVTGTGFGDYTSHAGSLAFLYARPITRSATMKLGYGIRVSDGKSLDGRPEVMHNIDVGVDYGRALSFSRRTSLTFGTGSAIAVAEDVPATDGQRRTSIRLTGHAALVHHLGRTWTASLQYSRGFRTQDGLDQLYFTDAVTAGIGGLVSRRLSLSANANWATSSLEYGSGGHAGTSASAEANYALNRFLALYAHYVFYKYAYDDLIQLDARIPRELDRHGVRVGVTTSVPFIR